MYFNRLFGSGLDSKSPDPREKVWAEYMCSFCGNTTEIDVTGRRNTFDFQRERRCPKCHQLSSEDKVINLKSQIEKLTSDKSHIEIQIQQLIEELNNCVQKGDLNGIQSNSSSEENFSGKN
jgi:hypothetical protein